MNLIWFILVGLVAGWLAGLIMRGSGYGLLANIILGIIGAIIGGFMFSLMGLTAYGTLGNIIMSVVGAVVFIGVVRLFKRA